MGLRLQRAGSNHLTRQYASAKADPTKDGISRAGDFLTKLNSRYPNVR